MTNTAIESSTPTWATTEIEGMELLTNNNGTKAAARPTRGGLIPDDASNSTFGLANQTVVPEPTQEATTYQAYQVPASTVTATDTADDDITLDTAIGGESNQRMDKLESTMDAILQMLQQGSSSSVSQRDTAANREEVRDTAEASASAGAVR